MAEWSIALPWKGSNWVTGSGVRIPVSPPLVVSFSYKHLKLMLILVLIYLCIY